MKKQGAICSFRLDDITADMNWDTFYEVKSVFDKYDIKPLIGVVPDNQDRTLQKGDNCGHFWDIVRGLQKNGWTVAQHGYRHVYCSRSGGLLGLKDVSEFAGLPYEAQYEKISRGKEILQKQGIYVTIFMAPGHTFDRNTLRALKDNDFWYLTDGYSARPYRRCGIIHIPCRSARPALGRGVDTVCLHTNAMKSGDIAAMEQFIGKYREHIVDYQEIIQIPAGFRTPVLVLEEWKNLTWRRVKKFAAQSQDLHEYLVETDAQNRWKKLSNRIINSPRLLVRLMKRKRNGYH